MELLIELYGIETPDGREDGFDVGLLIELYGIETLTQNVKFFPDYNLLIELYGIETDLDKLVEHGEYTFNRTIWN